MSELGVVEDTLFIPMMGRIYASEKCPSVLYDKKALSLKDKLPSGIIKNGRQNQYTLLASASRSSNMDRYIKNFIERKPNACVVQLGCGLETTFNRNDNGKTRWYEVDLPDVIEYRKTLLPESEREKYLKGDAFSDFWIKEVRSKENDAPILVTASGLFYYFTEEKIIGLLKMLSSYGDIEVLFDTVNKSGMNMMRKKYMKQVGHEDAKMFFYVDSASSLAAKVGKNVKVLSEEAYYSHINKSEVKIFTKISMIVSDRLNMVKMVHLSLKK